MSLFRISALLRSAGILRRNISSISVTVRLNKTIEIVPTRPVGFNLAKHVPSIYRNYSTDTAKETTNNTGIDVQAKLEELKSTNSITEASLIELVGECKKRNDFEMALQILKLAKDESVDLRSGELYSFVVSCGIKELRFSEIRELFGEPFPVNDQREDSNNNAEVVVSKNYNQIKSLLGEMRKNGVELNMWFYEQLVYRMHSIGQAGVIVNLILNLEKKGIVPSIALYNRALHIFPKKGLVERAEHLFNKLVMKGMANYNTYTTWMSSLVVMERFNEVEQLFRTMSKLFTPDIISYNILINSRLKDDNMVGALEVFDKLRMKEVEGVFPDSYTVSTFLDHMLVTGNVQHTQRIFPYLTEIGFPSTSQNYGQLLRFFARYDDSKFSPLLKSILVERKDLQDLYFYNSLLRILTDPQVLPEVKKDMGIAISEKFDMTYRSPLLDLMSCAPLATRSIVYLVETNGIKPDDFTLESIMRQMINRHEYDSVEGLYMYCRSLSFNTSYTLKNMRLTALLMIKNLPEAKSFLEDMRSHRVPVYPRNLSLCQEMNLELPSGVFSSTGGKAFKKKFVNENSSRKNDQNINTRSNAVANNNNINISNSNTSTDFI